MDLDQRRLAAACIAELPRSKRWSRCQLRHHNRLVLGRRRGECWVATCIGCWAGLGAATREHHEWQQPSQLQPTHLIVTHSMGPDTAPPNAPRALDAYTIVF